MKASSYRLNCRVCGASVEVRLRIFRVEFNGLAEVLDGAPRLPKSCVLGTAVGPSEGAVGPDLDGGVVALERFVVLAESRECRASIEVKAEAVVSQFYGFVVIVQGGLVLRNAGVSDGAVDVDLGVFGIVSLRRRCSLRWPRGTC